MTRRRFPPLAAAMLVAGCARPSTEKPAAAAGAANPFLTPSPLQYQAPPFDQIRDADYQPAIEQGMKENLDEIGKIASRDSAPTFANTIEAMERSGVLLTRVLKVFFAMTQANTDDTVRKVQAEEAPKLAAHHDAIYLDPKLFQRVKTLYDARDRLGLDAEQKFLLEKYHRDFVRAGANLDDANKATLRALNKEESTLTTEFQNRLLAATNAGAVVVEDRAELEGLSDGDLAPAAASAHAHEMAGKPGTAERLRTGMVPAATGKARGEAAKMQALIDRQQGGFKLAAWDWELYAEQVRKAEYDLDDAAVRPYFELDRVLKDGVFFAAGKLYGLTFKERKDLPPYQPDVRVFEVFDADGKSLALWYADYFARPSKSGGAWEDTFVDQAGLLGTRPVVFNVANFTKPAPGQPALLTFDDVKTMFHEFGHALHAMFSSVRYPTVAGTNVPRDFVEFPSQFNEHWALEPAVFRRCAAQTRAEDAT